jgi:hypothetical protein
MRFGPPVGFARGPDGHKIAYRYWAIEAVHHLCDVTFAEDTSQVRTGAGPSVMACLRNLVIGMLSRPGRSTSPPRYATTPATPPVLWPPSTSPSGAATHERTLRENVRALRQPYRALADRQTPFLVLRVTRQRVRPQSGRAYLAACAASGWERRVGSSGFSSEPGPSRSSEV